MKCIDCLSKVEIVNKKDRDTGMWANYWWCESCEKKTRPMPEDEIVMKSMDEEVSEETIKEIKRQFYESIKKPIKSDAEQWVAKKIQPIIGEYCTGEKDIADAMNYTFHVPKGYKVDCKNLAHGAPLEIEDLDASHLNKTYTEYEDIKK